MSFVPEDIYNYGITVQQWHYLSKLSLPKLRKLGELAQLEVEREQYEKLKAKFEHKEDSRL